MINHNSLWIVQISQLEAKEIYSYAIHGPKERNQGVVQCYVVPNQAKSIV